ncbi:MAG: MBL fold metallo-hydrolase [Candidatus Diapherotrites archaeon]|nr:MBL fold metallo-hydrolase [Candidatus Diapherotrites archaeon]
MLLKWIGHASIRLKSGDRTVYIDPYWEGDYSEKADVILITHPHFDHLDKDKISQVYKNDTIIICPESCEKELSGYKPQVIGQSETKSFDWFSVESIPAYNVNKKFHPKGFGVGYILTLEGKKVYHAGDTDIIPEMSSLAEKGIDYAFLPVGGVYTMDLTEAERAVGIIKPKHFIPMHYGTLPAIASYSKQDIKTENALVLSPGEGIEV